MKITNIPTYRFENGTVIQFFKVDKLPGFSHRVTINSIFVKDYLGNSFKPNQKVALYFYKKHAARNCAQLQQFAVES